VRRAIYQFRIDKFFFHFLFKIRFPIFAKINTGFSRKMKTTFFADENYAGRLDLFLAEKMGISRSAAQKIIRAGRVKISGKIAKKTGAEVSAGSKIAIENSPEKNPAEKLNPATNSDLKIIFEDSAFLGVEKPSGAVAVPDENYPTENVFSRVRKNFPNLKTVHRLDRETSGILLFAKNAAAASFLQKQFAARTVKKIYLAAVLGNLSVKFGTIDSPVARSEIDRQKMSIAVGAKKGRAAKTHFEILENFAGAQLLRVKLETGRTHQIRVHFAAIAHPLLRDEKYGNFPAEKKLKIPTAPRLFLHAAELEIISPATEKPVRIESELPRDLQTFLQKLQKLT